MKTFKYLVLFASLAMISFAACNSKEQKCDENDNSEMVTEASVEKTVGVELFFTGDDDTNLQWDYKGDKPCILDFYTTWCPPCKMLSPILDSIALEMSDVIYVHKIDAEQNGELAKLFDIESVPSVIYVPMNGDYVKEIGYRTKAECIEFINKYLFSTDTLNVK